MWVTGGIVHRYVDGRGDQRECGDSGALTTRSFAISCWRQSAVHATGVLSIRFCVDPVMTDPE
jgi:hypothetical protein